MMQPNQPGEPTYRRLKIVNVFDHKKQQRILQKLVDKLNDSTDKWKGMWHKDPKMDDWYVSGFVVFDKIYRINLGLYRDGFHIKVVDNESNYFDLNLRKYAFGDINKTSIWTQEFNKIEPMILEFCKELEKYFKEKKNEKK